MANSIMAHVEIVRQEDGTITGRISIPNETMAEYHGNNLEEILEQVTNYLDENLTEN